jgi:hypothetical protein
MTKPQDPEWKFNMENQMKEMMAGLKAIGEQLNNKPVRAREDDRIKCHQIISYFHIPVCLYRLLRVLIPL